MLRDSPQDRTVIKDFIKIFLLILFIGGVSFLCLLQRVRSRELDLEVARLNTERANLIKDLNQLDYRIEQLKAPERIIPLAKEQLGMY